MLNLLYIFFSVHYLQIIFYCITPRYNSYFDPEDGRIMSLRNGIISLQDRLL